MAASNQTALPSLSIVFTLKFGEQLRSVNFSPDVHVEKLLTYKGVRQKTIQNLFHANSLISADFCHEHNRKSGLKKLKIDVCFRSLEDCFRKSFMKLDEAGVKVD